MEVTTWEVARTPPGLVVDPVDPALQSLEWRVGAGPGTAASMLRDAGSWTPDDRTDFDEDDWWFRTTIVGLMPGEGVVELDGIATVAEVWFNGVSILASHNMFVSHRCNVDLAVENELVIICRSLRQHLAIRRRRPQWKTRLVSNQQLRWVRTTLLGRMPGWSARPAPVGPWRPVRVVDQTAVRVVDWSPMPRIEGRDGLVDVSCRIEGSSSIARLAVRVGRSLAEMHFDETTGTWSGEVGVSAPRRWFPHTHGEPALYPVSVEATTRDGDSVLVEQRPIGFRDVDASRWADDLQLVVNDVEVFARGACWVPPDVVRMWSDESSLREALRQVVEAGMNLLRVPGTMVYEQPMFHQLCDEFGIMVWQDFMFANMQYPIGDEEFRSSVDLEVSRVAARLRAHPSTVLMCGGSEVEQQAAMMGAGPTVTGDHELGRQFLAERVAVQAPSVLYVSNSPSGGSLPFYPSSGVAHYFGVGAYLRPLEDTRFTRVRFASECLAIANVPDVNAVDRVLNDGTRAPHSPRWKAGVPRDGGTGWDFDDVRDHYLERIFGIDPLELRYAEPNRYLQYSRVTSHVMIRRSLAEWRRTDNVCSGAILLQLRDVVPGAGWGLVDVWGAPKAAYYAVQSACRPRTVLLHDDGLDGVTAVVHNDEPDAFSGVLEVKLYNHAGNIVDEASTPVELAAHSTLMLSVDGMLEVFSDLTRCYRFGPERIDLVAVSLCDSRGEHVASDHYLPGGQHRPLCYRSELAVDVEPRGREIDVTVTAAELAQFVSIELDGFRAMDNWFHVEPGGARTVRCVSTGHSGETVQGVVNALNVADGVTIRSTVEWS